MKKEEPIAPRGALPSDLVIPNRAVDRFAEADARMAEREKAKRASEQKRRRDGRFKR